MTREGDYLWYYDLSYHAIAKTNMAGVALGNLPYNDSTIRDVAWDGSYLWALNTSGKLTKLSKGGIVQETITDLLTGGWGICYDGATLWTSDPVTDKIYHISLTNDETPPGPPLVASTTHPLSTVWYSDSHPTLTWTPPDDPSGIVSYSYLFDTSPATIPDPTPIGSNTSVSYLLFSDGVWYFHCRARDGSGNWGETAHFRLLVDTTPPGQGTIVINNGADTTSAQVVLLHDLAVDDSASGMGQGSAMKFSNDGFTWSDGEPFAAERSGWDLSQYGGNTLSGTKTVYVTFSDAAGNWSGMFSDDIVYSAPLLITVESLAAGTVGFSYADTLTAAGGWPPYRWEVVEGTLPPGMNLDENGFISGEPQAEGDFTFTVRVTDANMTADTMALSMTFSIVAVKGDVNGDVLIDILDLVQVIRYILHIEVFTPTQIWAADVQVDGVVNILDALSIVNIILGTPMAKTATFSGDATLVLDRSAGETDVYSLLLDSRVPVAGIQLSLRLPQGGKAVPVTSHSSFTMSHTEESGTSRIVFYSPDGTSHFFDGQTPFLTFECENGTGTVEVEHITLADEYGRSIPAAVKTGETSTPAGWTLQQNYPNPFNPTTALSYQLSAVSDQTTHHSPPVTLKIYNLLGQEVRTLVDAYQSPGEYTVTWDGRDVSGAMVPSGVYFCRMNIGRQSQSIKMILSK